MPDSSVLLAHIVSQTRQNVDFLISQHVISQADASVLLSKLSDSSVLTLANQTQNLTMHSTPSTASDNFTGYPAMAPRDAKFAIVPARALWDYQGLESNDLSFRAGDIIEILEETNVDWWTGRLNSSQGLFPSSYVEKINNSSKSQSPSTTSPYPRNAPYDLVPSGSPYPSQEAPPYQPVAGYPPQGGSYSGQSPPQQVTYNVYSAAPVQPPPQAPQKSKFGGSLGSTLAHAAAGGVGFGAGSAVGNDLINAIF